MAFDVTPLLTFRTGIGISVQETWAALNALEPGPHLIPYALGLRAKVTGEGLPDGSDRCGFRPASCWPCGAGPIVRV